MKCCWNIKVWAVQKHVNLVDLVKSFPTNIYLQNLASIQPRTSPKKFESSSSREFELKLWNFKALICSPAYSILMAPAVCGPRTMAARAATRGGPLIPTEIWNEHHRENGLRTRRTRLVRWRIRRYATRPPRVESLGHSSFRRTSQRGRTLSPGTSI